MNDILGNPLLGHHSANTHLHDEMMECQGLPQV